MKFTAENQETLAGIVVVNKPQGMTSHDVVAIARRRLKTRRIGHAGTLDPLATGVLVLLVGKATKLFNQFEGFDKAYKATILLGTKTDTADIQGQAIAQAPFQDVTRERFESILPEFRGQIEQTPPMVSAVKMNGRRLYELARKGIQVKRQMRTVSIHTLEMIEFTPPDVKIFLECSKGTYVRKIAEDIGDRLGCLACIRQIERTRVGPFEIDDALDLNQLDASHLRPWTGRQGGRNP